MAASAIVAWPRRGRQLLPFVPVAWAAVATVLVGADHISTDSLPTTYSAVDHAARAIDLAAGLALLAAALATFAARSAGSLGVCALASGIAWFAPDVEGWTSGPATVRSLGALLVPLLAPAQWLTILAAAPRRARPRRLTIAAAAAAGLVAALALARAVVRDPLLDPNCWRDCYDHALLVSSRPGLASALDKAWLGASVALGTALVVTAAWLVVTASGGVRRLLAATLLTGGLLGATEAVYAASLLVIPVEDPRRDVLLDLFYVRAGATAAFGAALVAGALLLARRRRRTARLAVALANAPEPGRLRDTLAAAFADPKLEVAFWLPADRRYVDTEGRFVPSPVASGGRAVTHIVREDRPIAAVVHDAALLDTSFERELGSAARLAVENERLQAEVRAQLEALRASRTRITERADMERRRLERDLHDGAQQRLLALSFDLRLARSAAESERDEQTAARLAAAVDEAAAALEELRELAHGIFPAILSEAGLAAALESLADESPLPVAVTAPREARFPASTEAALYVAAKEAIEDAVARNASLVRIELGAREDVVSLSVDDDGRDRDTALVHVEDRVGALGGKTEAGATWLRAVVPCA